MIFCVLSSQVPFLAKRFCTRWGGHLFREVLLNVFSEFPRLLGCTAAAMLPQQARGTFRKLTTKPSEQVAAPPGPPICLPSVNAGTIPEGLLINMAPEVGTNPKSNPIFFIKSNPHLLQINSKSKSYPRSQIQSNPNHQIKSSQVHFATLL